MLEVRDRTLGSVGEGRAGADEESAELGEEREREREPRRKK